MVRTTARAQRPKAAPRGKTGRTDRRQARTEAILDEAMRLLLDDGFEGFKMARLAESLGYAVGALYRYFPSKERLLVELQRRILADLERHASRLFAAIEDAVDAEPAVLALSQVIAAARFYRALPRLMPESFRLIAFAVGDPRELVPQEDAARVMDAAAPLLAALAARIGTAQETGAIAPGAAVERAVILWASVHGVVQLEKLMRVDAQLMNTERLGERLVQDLLRGWGASADRLAAALARLEVLEARGGVAELALPTKAKKRGRK